MARAIDADVFIRDLTAMKKMYDAIELDGMIKALKEAPTIDPVIRCRDCAVPHNKWTGCPKLNGLVPPDNFYCAFGVRRDSDGKSD